MRAVAVMLMSLGGLSCMAGCGGARMEVSPRVPPCRADFSEGASVSWIAPGDAVGRRMLSSWCDTVGPVGIHRRGAPPPDGDTILVTWNVHAGAGDIRALLASLREREQAAGRRGPNVILLVQEAIRSGAAPARVPEGSPMPRRIQSRRAPVADILEVARREDLNAVYVPSMRNGREGANGRSGQPEDRGNAILSTLPLSEILAIELPFDAQRRVAVSARVEGEFSLRVVSVHLDTSGGQGRQAAALLDALALSGESRRLVLGGDFNTAMRRRAVIRSSGLEVHRLACRGVTHKFFQLDHLLVRGLDAAPACVRLDPFGSDHAPLAITLSSPHRTGAAALFRSMARVLPFSRK